MKYIVFALLTLSAINVFSEVTVVEEGEKLLLRSKSCSELYKSVSDLNKWAKNVGETNNYKPHCSCVDSDCTVEVNKTGPKVFQKFAGVTPQNLGLNCFSSALVSNNILPALGFSSHNEIVFWLRSDLCVRVPPASPKVPGDIIHIESFKTIPRARHSFTHVNKELAFSKNGIGAYVSPNVIKNFPYQLLHPDEVYNHPGFQIDPKCIDISKSNAKKKNCHSFVQYYRCDPLKEYIAKNPLSMEIAQTWYTLEKLDKQMSEKIMNTNGVTEDKRKLNKIIAEIHMLAQRKSFDPVDKNNFYWKAILHRTESLRSQYKFLSN